MVIVEWSKVVDSDGDGDSDGDSDGGVGFSEGFLSK